MLFESGARRWRCWAKFTFASGLPWRYWASASRTAAHIFGLRSYRPSEHPLYRDACQVITISQYLPRSPYITLYALPRRVPGHHHLSLHLPTSHYISVHLPVSPYPSTATRARSSAPRCPNQRSTPPRARRAAVAAPRACTRCAPRTCAPRGPLRGRRAPTRRSPRASRRPGTCRRPAHPRRRAASRGHHPEGGWLLPKTGRGPAGCEPALSRVELYWACTAALSMHPARAASAAQKDCLRCALMADDAH